VWPADLKRHLKSKQGQQKSTLKQQQPYTLTPEQQPCTFTHDRDRIRLERKMCKDCWFSKYNRVLLHYSVSMAAARGRLLLLLLVVASALG
jgi:hypothetical protein